MKKSEGKTGKKPSSTSKAKITSSAPQTRKQEASGISAVSKTSPPPRGITKKTRTELVAIAQSLGVPIDPKDRRVDLIEKIRDQEPEKNHETRTEPAKNLEVPPTPAPIMPPRYAEPVPPSSSHPVPSHSSARTAKGWKDFLDIPYEPIRREKGHSVTILSITPFRIIAFFAMDRELDPDLTQRIDQTGLVLKIRDITGAVERGETRIVAYADHVFDIMTGTATKWHIPLWAPSRWLEAWLGFYDNGSFKILARSKLIKTSLGSPTQKIGSLFHLRDILHYEGSPMEAFWRRSLTSSLVKLPTSHEIPSSYRKP